MRVRRQTIALFACLAAAVGAGAFSASDRETLSTSRSLARNLQNALEPFMGQETVRLHHDAHGGAYIETLNAAIVGTPFQRGITGGSSPADLEKVVKSSFRSKEKNATSIFNSASQVWNHNFFWDSMGPGKQGSAPAGALLAAINSGFGSVDKMAAELEKVGKGVFGSGWAWLVYDRDCSLRIVPTPNGESPLAYDDGTTAILNVDVWEHSYYLDYKNKRTDYLKAFVDNLVDWEKVLARYAAACPKKGKKGGSKGGGQTGAQGFLSGSFVPHG